jgi:phage protein D
VTEQLHLSHVSLKIDGAPAPDDAQTDLIEVVVDQSLHLPSMFTLRLYSHDMRWLEAPFFREGKKVEVYYGEQPPVKLLSGKIAGLEPELGEEEPILVVRGYDMSHTLYRGRHRRSFNQVTDADLVRQLAGEAKLTPGLIDPTPQVHEYVFQNNQTNAEFLLERARRVGYELWLEDDELHFRKPGPNGRAARAAIRLAWGDNLRSFRPRLSTAEQVNEVEVRGWDPKRKREVVGSARRGDGAPEIGVQGTGADIARSAWGEAKIAVVDQFVRSPSEAEALAQATLDELASVFVEAEGTCDANTDITPGRQVELDGVGRRFNGTYYVTRVVHEWGRDGGMVTHFTVSGRRDRGVWSLLEESAPRPVGLGVVIGVVTNNRDPEEMGRVRVKFPWLSDREESAWARVVSPTAGSRRGLFWLPEVDDEVLVAFEHGDVHRPFVVGALWNGQDKTPMNASEAVGGDGKVNKRIVKSRSGHTILLDDTSGAEEITIVDKTGNNKIVLHSPDNSMRIAVQGDLTIEAQGKITLKAQRGVDVSSQADVKVDAVQGVDVSSKAKVTVAGQGGAELSSAVEAKVKGSMVGIEGSGTVTVQGALIKLN